MKVRKGTGFVSLSDLPSDEEEEAIAVSFEAPSTFIALISSCLTLNDQSDTEKR